MAFHASSSKSAFIPCASRPFTSNKNLGFFSSVCAPKPFSSSQVLKPAVNRTCTKIIAAATGLQSPIDVPNNGTISQPIANAPDITQSTMVLTKSELTDPGTNFEMRVENVGFPGTVKFDGITYELDQLHLHNKSENKLDGRQFPIEMHLVHTRGKNDVCVLAIFFDFGPHNEEFDKVLDAMQEEGSNASISVEKMLGAGLTTAQLLTFQGSFTTPPFTPGVQWIVSKEIPKVSPEQVRRYQTTPHVVVPNNRAIQDSQNRPIIAYF